MMFPSTTLQTRRCPGPLLEPPLSWTPCLAVISTVAEGGLQERDRPQLSTFERDIGGGADRRKMSRSLQDAGWVALLASHVVLAISA